MADIQDPLLEEQKGISSEGLEYSFVAIPKRVIVIVSAYIQLIWEIKNFRKSTSAKKVIENAKEMFEANDRSVQDSLWQEHCAASLRELVDCNITADFLCILKCLPKPTNNRGERESVYMCACLTCTGH